MVIGMKYGEVASWWFETNKIPELSGKERDVLLSFLNSIDQICKILISVKLLIPSEMHLEDWVRFDHDKENIIRVNKPSLKLEIGSNTSIKKAILNALDKEFENDNFLFPLELKILGSGVVVDQYKNENLFPNVIWLHAITFGKHIINICTQSYAWMKFDLYGQPQDLIFRNNKDGLEKILAEISDFLDVEPIHTDTEYAYVNGYKLLNRFDIDGVPISFF